MTDVVLILRPAPSTIPAPMRLRRALKALRRVYGFPCIYVQEISPACVPSIVAGIEVVKRRVCEGQLQN